MLLLSLLPRKYHSATRLPTRWQSASTRCLGSPQESGVSSQRNLFWSNCNGRGLLAGRWTWCRCRVQASLWRGKYMSDLRCVPDPFAQAGFAKAVSCIGRNYQFCKPGCGHQRTEYPVSIYPLSSFAVVDPHALSRGVADGDQARPDLHARRPCPLPDTRPKAVSSGRTIRYRIDSFVNSSRGEPSHSASR